MSTCFDTCFKTTDLYRYKHEFVSIQNRKNRLYVYFSFIHSSTNPKPLLPHTVSPINPHPKIFKLPQNSTKFHKINTHSLRIQYPLKSPSLISWTKSYLLQFKEFIKLGLWKFQKVLHQKCKVNRSTSLSSCNGT